MLSVRTNRNCVYQTAYRMVFCPKYRKAILTGAVVETLNGLLEQICQERNWTILSKELQPDHVHLFVSLPPAIAVADAVKILKGVTARRLFQQIPVLKRHLWNGHLWSPSYSVGTAGNVSAETIRRYIERTEHSKGRH